MPEAIPPLMDRAYEGTETRQLVLDLAMIPVVPPKSNRPHPWDYVYKKRNEIERLFRRLKGFRRIFSDFEKLDVFFLGFLLLRTHRRGPARSVNTLQVSYGAARFSRRVLAAGVATIFIAGPRSLKEISGSFPDR
jgi:transposase